ncbi:TetR family transcriptional regulator [Streptococcus sp. zg-86]|uniref:TetR family transcriptional regulator n=1 Tax=Streptococcus zhangguiae TaxID=2664091 RepID=A0A6I4RNN4_9STRE|nr:MULTISPECIES: TetR/AcrR family transcriptional regulator [unclassified Streptococcus]MTB63764.1 TetR family transcriptional regulator [Streptococcus sp. zg-86]MTB90074.1 TetR family transcriptional regulator [Streptococcus sp. zg-36]MWV55745.1 TetR family transcriptional regulator [Streptococcus sp. zg-70]QTH47965.1 TetR/AcrR family transcriptional regulator [Streptococcus sp. zg-86]
MKQQDLRVLKTEKNIKDSFIALLQEKTFSAITIQNILDTAVINRSTFYRHYADKFDLANHINQELVVQIKRLLEIRYRPTGSVALTIQEMNQEFQSFFEQKELFLAMLTISHEEVHLREDLLNVMISHYQENFNQEDLEAQLFASIVFTTLFYSLTHNQVLELEMVKKSMVQLMENFKKIN